MATIQTPTSELGPDESPLVSHPGRRMTEEEFVEWCRGFERIRAEWADGEVVVMSPVNFWHLRLGEFLLRVLMDYVEAHDLGEVQGPELTNRFRAGTRLVRLVPDI